MKRGAARLIFFSLLLCSCESEYDRQLQAGKRIVTKNKWCDLAKNPSIKRASLLSGNPKLFELELKNFQDKSANQLLITKFP